MLGDEPVGYLSKLLPAQAEDLARVNGPGLKALHRYLASEEAVAFLGAGVSAPLYPLWNELIGELVDIAVGRLSEREAATCRALAQRSPEEVVEIIRQTLGAEAYREVLREVLRARVDPESGRSWTPAQELVCRCAFKAVVTTNFDPGIVDARMKLRPGASATGFTTWEDELGLDQWRTGDVFGKAELPVLFAHGQHNRPDSIVLATTEYRRAYAGKLSQVLGRLVDSGHLVWIGFSFTDQRITAILREIADQSGTRIDPGGAPRHVAMMAWDPRAEGNDPGVLALQAEIAYGAQVVLYPAPDGDHSALGLLLASLTDNRFPPATVTQRRSDPRAGKGRPDAMVRWVPEPEHVEHFTGRAEELARLDRWAADPQVALVGVTAWGGAGKTTLVTHWAMEAGGLARRAGVRGIFGWSFYADSSAEHWATALLEWAQRDLGVQVTGIHRSASAVLTLIQTVPLLLVLDGLEVMQEGPAGGEFGRLLDGTLREVLVGACQQQPGGLVLLTSRFPFADLETFDGSSARMLDVPPFTSAEGSALLAAIGGGWLPETERRALVEAVDGHALAVGVVAALLATHPPASDLTALRAELDAAARTNVRVGRVLKFYAARLSEPDRYLLAAVALFARPVEAAAVLAVSEHETFGDTLDGWTPDTVQAAVRERLGGLATWYPDGTISAHPLVRDSFRRLVMDAADTAAETNLSGIPAGTVASRGDALRVVEAIELLLDANHWQAANHLYTIRGGNPPVWLTLPAARLGQRAATAFTATEDRRTGCVSNLGVDYLGYYLNAAGVYAMIAGDLATAQQYLHMAVRQARDGGETERLAIRLTNLTECFGHLGETVLARNAAAEALTIAETVGGRNGIRNLHACLGWVAVLAGDAREAEQQFIIADQIQVRSDPDGAHLCSLSGTQWAEWLACTGRFGPAQTLTDRNAEISQRNEWNDDLARCDRLLGRLALAAGNTTAAGNHLVAAARCFRAGDYLTELATTLTDLAIHAQASGDLDAAERHAAEAVTIAAPRGLIPAHCAALAARARVRADQVAASADQALLFQGRDAADAALRLAIRHHLPWHELDALRSHALLDRAEHADHGWATQADALHSGLIPPDLDPNPLTTVEQ